jgi:hypothetical protein
MDKIKIAIHSDRLDLHSPAHLITAALHTENVELIPRPRWQEADFILNIDSIHNTGLFRGKKTIYWEIDDTVHLATNGQYYDVDKIFIVSDHLVNIYPKGTVAIPMAAEPTVHYKWSLPETINVSFIGGIDDIPSYKYRREVLDELKPTIIGAKPQDYPKFMSQSKINLNVMPQIEGGKPLLNCRFFEAMASGCLLNDYHPLLDKYATEGVHYVGFRSISEAKEKIDYYLNNEQARLRIINNARQHILDNHTWEHRLQQIIKEVENGS